jgi:hypothetical protein
MKKYLYLLLLVLPFGIHAQQDSISKKIILIPYAPFMYFSDADMHLSQANRITEQQVREKIRNEFESDLYYQLLSRFDVVSLLRATTLNGEDDLRRIYGTTSYVKYNAKAIKNRERTHEESKLTQYTDQMYKKTKGQILFAQDTNVMVAVFNDMDVFKQLVSRYKADYVLFVTQFEINTSNKNTLEWQYREYQREYAIHYNLFNRAGELIRAEVVMVAAGKENDLKIVRHGYIAKLAEKMKFILNTLHK